MSDIKNAITSEIRRISKREIKIYFEPISKKLAEQKRVIANLKKEILELRKSVSVPKKEVDNKIALNIPKPDKTVRLNGKGIRRIREKFNLTQESFANLLGISKATFCNWESGRISPKPEFKMKIAALRNLSSTEIKNLLNSKILKEE